MYFTTILDIFFSLPWLYFLILLQVRLLFQHHVSKTVFWDKDSSFTWCNFFFFFFGIHSRLINWISSLTQALGYVLGSQQWPSLVGCLPPLSRVLKVNIEGSLMLLCSGVQMHEGDEGSWGTHLMGRLEVGGSL